MLLERHGRHTGNRHTGRHVAHHTALRGDPSPAANDEMPAQADLTAYHDMIAELGAAGDAYLRDQDAATSNLDVVPDLHEIINHGAGADDRVRSGAAVDRG